MPRPIGAVDEDNARIKLLSTIFGSEPHKFLPWALLLTAITLNFADNATNVPGSHHSALLLEASDGVFFSTLPIRSFTVTPVFTKGVVTDKMISQNVLRPTPVPFAAANYRLTDDLSRIRWKSNIYWTGAIGINPNTLTADFATGRRFRGARLW